MKRIKVTGSVENNRDIINMCRGSQTPALMDRRIVDIDDDSKNPQQVYLATKKENLWLSPGMWVIEIRPGVFDVAHNYN